MLETKRLLLRPWELSDAENLYKYAKDPMIGPMAGWPVHTSVDNSAFIIKSVLSAPETYAVVSNETQCAIGSIGLMIGKASDLAQNEQEAEIGYWIGVPFWGQGLIPEAAQEIIRYAFEELDIKILWCGYFEGNVKSKRAQEKCGFHYHHTIFNKECVLLDEVRNECVTRLTKEDWLQMKKCA